MTFRQRHLALPVAVAIVAGCLAPLAVLVAFSFYEVEDFDLIPAFSFRAWGELATSTTDWFLIGKAVLSGVTTTVFTALLGYPVALVLTRLATSAKGLAIIVLLTPLYTGEIVRIYAWRIVLGGEGLVNTVLQGLGLIDEPLKFLLFSPFTIGPRPDLQQPALHGARHLGVGRDGRPSADRSGARSRRPARRCLLPCHLSVDDARACRRKPHRLRAVGRRNADAEPSGRYLGGRPPWRSSTICSVRRSTGRLPRRSPWLFWPPCFLVASAMAGLLLRLKGARAVIGRT